MNTLRKPIVGLTPLWDKEKCVLKPMQETYLEAVETAGGEPRVLDVADEASAREELASCDALISTGGGDIAPELYGEARIESCGSSCPARDTFELITFRIALEREPLPATRSAQDEPHAESAESAEPKSHAEETATKSHAESAESAED